MATEGGTVADDYRRYLASVGDLLRDNTGAVSEDV